MHLNMGLAHITEKKRGYRSVNFHVLKKKLFFDRGNGTNFSQLNQTEVKVWISREACVCENAWNVWSLLLNSTGVFFEDSFGSMNFLKYIFIDLWDDGHPLGHLQYTLFFSQENFVYKNVKKEISTKFKNILKTCPGRV